MEEAEVPDDFMMLPAGATRELGAHKGYSMAVMIEVLAGILGGNGGGPNRRRGASHHFIAYNLEAFTDIEDFKTDMDEYMRALSRLQASPGPRPRRLRRTT